MTWKGNIVLGRRPVVLADTYSEEEIVGHIASAEERIADLETTLAALVPLVRDQDPTKLRNGALISEALRKAHQLLEQNPVAKSAYVLSENDLAMIRMFASKRGICVIYRAK